MVFPKSIYWDCKCQKKSMQILWWLHYEKFLSNSDDLMKKLSQSSHAWPKTHFQKLHAVFRKSFFVPPFPRGSWGYSLSYQRLEWVESFSSKPKSNLPYSRKFLRALLIKKSKGHSTYIRIKNPLHKQSEKACMCF